MGLSSKLASSDDVAALDWPQEILEAGGLVIPKPTNQARNSHGEHQRREHWPPLKCPRCESANTKFCYYNNYSRTQPRHFCKACKRHWTEGGTLRNVPVGGGRKNKRSKATTPASTSAAATSTATAASGAVAAKANSIGSAPLPLPLPSKFPLLFNGDHGSNVVPEILRQILLRPPQPTAPPPPPPPPLPLPQLQLATSDYSVASSFPANPSLPASFNSREGDDNSTSNPPFSMISSSCSYALPSATEDAASACSAAAGAWQVGQAPALPSTTGFIDHSAADYWSGWDDDMGGSA